ncbi:MAG TPA: hypothetical protein VNX65_00400 [Patescibacteria group bacterium]|nr:hypothetical protein [Patescibacteria group bacterium]
MSTASAVAGVVAMPRSSANIVLVGLTFIGEILFGMVVISSVFRLIAKRLYSI